MYQSNKPQSPTSGKHPNTTTCRGSWINPVNAGAPDESWYCKEHQETVWPNKPQSPPTGDKLDEILQHFYNRICSTAGQSFAGDPYTILSRSAKAQLNAYMLAEVLQTQVNIWANFKHELTKRDLSSDVMPKGARKMTEQELLAGVIGQEQAKATARFGKGEA